MFNLLRNSKGMSLVEIMIVIAIMAVIGTLAVTNVMPMRKKANYENTKIMMRDIENALQLYYTDNNSYPTTEQGLEALIEKPSVGAEPTGYNPSGYLKGKKLPKDQWGQAFMYDSDGSRYKISSYAQDKKEGGTGFDEDIVVESE